MNRVPAEVRPFGHFVYEELRARGWSLQHLAAKMSDDGIQFAVNCMTLNLLMAVQEDGLMVGDELFADLSIALGLSEQMLRNYDAAWRDNPTSRTAWECPEDFLIPMEQSN